MVPDIALLRVPGAVVRGCDVGALKGIVDIKGYLFDCQAVRNRSRDRNVVDRRGNRRAGNRTLD